MRLPDVVERLVPRSERRIPGWQRVLAVPAVAFLVVLGNWVTGGVLTDNFLLAMALTGVFLLLGTMAVLVVALRWRKLALPVLATFLLVAGGISAFLLIASNRDVVVHEQVVVAMAPRAGADPASAASVPVAIKAGAFRSGEHTTTGTATLISLPTGGRVLTLTSFATSPGPDLRVYLVPGDGSVVDAALDLGHLKGNRGDQQYSVPSAANLDRYGAVVVWCRAFSVDFGTAQLG